MPIPAPTGANTGYPYGETAVRLRAALVTDPYSGEPIERDWDNAESVEISGFGFDPGGSTESVEVGRNQVTTQPSLLHPDPWIDVRADDRIVIRGRTWHVDGDPLAYRSPLTGWEAGVQIKLEAVEG